MTTTNDMLRRTFLVGLLLLSSATIAQSGPMYVWVVADPGSTAGAGVPAQNGMTVTSSKTGAGKFQVYAVDEVDGSFGIKVFNVKLNGTITTFLNRSPSGAWNDTDGAGPYAQGFNDIRTANAATGITSGGQSPTNPYFVKGFGISASNFVAADASAPNWDSSSTTQAASGRWGTYSATLGAVTSGVVPGSGHFRNAILLAEGDYTGAAPTIDLVTPASSGGTVFSVLTSATGGSAATVGTISSVAILSFPEPAALVLVGLAAAGMGGLIGRRRR
jgi:hypothetical protein